jgi:NADP-dependent 3-hydroxy acid dehydrogenase YdfG
MGKDTLKGSIAIITGASSGIGEATAYKLAGLGVTIVLIARRKERIDKIVAGIQNKGGTAFGIEADITDEAAANRAVQDVVARYGGIDILVNNAGLMLLGNIDGANASEWQRMIDINLLGLLYMTHAALPHLKKAAANSNREVADVINIASVAAFQFNAINGVYALTKAGVNALSESLRQEVAKKFHVRVGVIEPGSVATELASHNSQEIQDGVLRPYFNEIEILVPDDIADAVAYILTRPRRASVNKLWVGPTEQI